jgi:hypothetical protein
VPVTGSFSATRAPRPRDPKEDAKCLTSRSRSCQRASRITCPINSAEEQYGEEDRAHRVAWSAVENKYEKNQKGNWVKKDS